MRFPFYLIVPGVLLSLLSYFIYNVQLDIDSVGYFSKITLSVLLIGAAMTVLGLYIGISRRSQRPLYRPSWVNFTIGFASIWAVILVVLSLLLLLQSIVEAFVGIWITISTETSNRISESLFAFALIVLLALLHGLLYGKYRFKVEEISLEFDDLPGAFDGFRIAQISDVHSGTWDNLKEVARGIQMIQDQAVDMIVFTGDIVNSNKNEIDPFIDLFAALKAPYGKYAILGNHDYYGQPMDAALRPAYYEDFYEKFKRMGWDLLLNEHRIVQKDGHQLILAGVENWGEGRYFPKRGDIHKSLLGSSQKEFCILLSHDPSHWENHVLDHPQQVHLTLSGHTHGMQFGLKTKWLSLSPIRLRYKHWIGLYKEKNRMLYVNRGFGVLGFSGRVGMWPEITVITLTSKTS